jgi:predicted secreted protein
LTTTCRPAAHPDTQEPKVRIDKAAFPIACALALVLQAGCERQAAAPEPTPRPAEAAPAAREAPTAETPRAAPMAVVTDADDGRALKLRPGEVFEVRLQADRVAGYSWIPANNPMPVVGTDGPPLYETEEGAPEQAPGIEVWRFIGRNVGHAHIQFDYRKPWEGDAPAERTVTIHVDVE